MNIFQFRISSDNHACLSIHIIIIKPVEVVLMLSQIQAPIPAYQIQLPPPPNPGMSKGMERFYSNQGWTQTKIEYEKLFTIKFCTFSYKWGIWPRFCQILGGYLGSGVMIAVVIDWCISPDFIY